MKNVIRLSEQQIEDHDYREFLQHYSEERLTRQRRGASLMGTLSIVIHSPPNSRIVINRGIRDYYRGLHQVWPGILFYGDLENHSTKFFVYSQLEKAFVVTCEGDSDFRIVVERSELCRWLHRNLPHVVRLGRAGGLGMDQIVRRVMQVLSAFDVPPDVFAKLAGVHSQCRDSGSPSDTPHGHPSGEGQRQSFSE